MQSLRHEDRGDGRAPKVFPHPPAETRGGISLHDGEQHPRHSDHEDHPDADDRALPLTAHESSERPRESQRLQQVRRVYEEKEEGAPGQQPGVPSRFAPQLGDDHHREPPGESRKAIAWRIHRPPVEEKPDTGRAPQPPSRAAR